MLVRHERMGPHMLKIHLSDMPEDAVQHYFTAPDLGDPHDHPWSFVSTILMGGYVEEVFGDDGRSKLVHRKVGDTFRVHWSHIHRIVELPEGVAITMIEPREASGQKSRFYRWEDGMKMSRAHDEPDFAPHR